MNEALKLLSNEFAAIGEPEFATLLRSLPPKTQDIWKALIDEARNSPQSTNTTVRAMLASLRNRSSFHYRRELPDSFGKFLGASTTVFNHTTPPELIWTARVTTSQMPPLSWTTKSAGGDRGRNTDAEVAELARNVNNAFAMLINAFLGTRGGKPSPSLIRSE